MANFMTELELRLRHNREEKPEKVTWQQGAKSACPFCTVVISVAREAVIRENALSSTQTTSPKKIGICVSHVRRIY